ncbi:MAG: prolyl-tRNA synthetase associated domain-containing protein [Bacillota bacterium]
MNKDQEQRIYTLLDELGISYDCYQHPAVYTIEAVHQLDMDMGGCHCKNLFIRNRKGDKHYLLIVEESKRLDLKKLSQQINSIGLSFASEERLLKYLGLTPGAVSPFGLIHDENKEVEVLIDQDIANIDLVCFHPNVNTATITLSYEAFEKFLQWSGNTYSYIQVPSVE